MYRAVPLRLLRSRYGMCCFVFGSRYCLAIPKSTTCITGHGVNNLRAHTSERKTRTIGSLGPWSTNEKVIGFDVAIDQVLLVYCLHTRDLPILFSEAWPKFRPGITYHLPCGHAHRLDREFTPTHIEQVLEAGP